MSKSFGSRSDEVRRRVRDYLLSEAVVSAKESGTRFRGEIDATTGFAKPEAAGGAMGRFRASLEKAEVGDVFYLTYGIATLTPVEVEGEEHRVQYTDRLIKDVKNVLFGQYTVSDDDLDRKQDEDRERESTFRDSSSSMAQAHRLVKLGMERIREVQAERIGVLKSVVGRITSEGGQLNSVAELTKIFRLNAKDVAGLKSENAKTRSDTVSAFRAALYGGGLPLQDSVMKGESQLIGAAEMVAYGDMIREMSIEQTDIPGAQRVTRGGEKTGVAKDVGNSRSILKSIAGLKEVKQGDKIVLEVDPAAKERLSKETEKRAIDILIGGCASLLTFSGPKIRITSGRAHRLLEQSGLPLPVLMTTIEVLLADIKYGEKFRGPSGYLSTSGSDPLHSFSFISWGSHLDPKHTIEVAEGFIGVGPLSYAQSPTGRALRAGDRLKNYRDPSADAVIRKITGSAAAMAVISKMEDEKRLSMTPDEAAQLAEVTGQDESTVNRIVKGLLLARDAKRDAAHLGGKESEQDYLRERGGARSSSEVAEAIARLASGETAERMIYERIMRNILYGATLVCVGKGAETSLTRDALKSSAEQVRQFPVFAAKIEVPKQTRTRSIEDIDTLGRLVSVGGPSFAQFSKQKGDPLETGKVATPGEQTAFGRSKSPRSEIHTPNLKIKLSDGQIMAALEEGTIGELLSNPDSYKISKPIRVPYIEKRTMTRRRMTIEDVLSLESFYDSRLRSRKASIQLLGAKKVHDDSIARKTVTDSHIETIPEMGILPMGAIAETDQRVSEETRRSMIKQLGEKTVNAISKLSPAISGSPDSVESFDLTDRVVSTGWRPNDLKAEVERTIKKLQTDAVKLGITPLASYKRTLAAGLLRDLRSSHSVDSDTFETRVNTRVISYALRSLLAEASKIRSMQPPADMGDVDLIPVSRGMRGVDPRAAAALEAIHRGILQEIEGSELRRIPAVSYVAIAGLTRSSSTIEDRIGKLSVQHPGDPARQSSGRVVAPLAALYDSAGAGANVLLTKNTLGLQDAIDRIQGTVPLRSAQSSSDFLDPSDEDPTELTRAYEDLVSRTEKLEGALPTGSQYPMEDALSGLEKLTSDLETSSFAQAIRGMISGLKPTPRDLTEWSNATLKDTTMQAFLRYASAAFRPNQSLDEAIEAAIDFSARNVPKDVREQIRSTLQKTDFGDLVRSAISVAGKIGEAAGQRTLSRALLSQALSLQEFAVDLMSYVDEVASGNESGADLSQLKQDIAELSQRADGILQTAQSYDFDLDGVLDAQRITERMSRAASLAAYSFPDLAQSSISIAQAIIGDDTSAGLFRRVADAFKINVASPRRKKAEDVIAGKRAGFAVNPGAVKEDLDKFETLERRLKPEQIDLIRAVLGDVKSADLSTGTDPYQVAARIVLDGQLAKSSSPDAQEFRSAVLAAFFPGVTPGELKDMISRGRGNAIILLRGDLSLRERARLIRTAVDKAVKARAAVERESMSGGESTEDLASIYDYLLARGDTRGMVNQVREPEEIPTGEREIEARPRGMDVKRVAVGPGAVRKDLTATAKFQADVAREVAAMLRRPKISQPSTGQEEVTAGEMATYPAAAAKAERAADVHADLQGPEGTFLPEMTVGEALQALATDSLTLNGEKLDRPTAAEIQEALMGAQAALSDLMGRKGVGDPLAVPLNMVSRRIKRLMPGGS